MHLAAHIDKASPRKRGFSLIELALVLGISGLMLGFVLQSQQSAAVADCYAATKLQLRDIDGALQRFARQRERLPMPASRTVGVEAPTYGREASGGAIDSVAGTSWGALPFQALGLAPSYASDCWGNKLTYVVTTALTTNATSGGYLDATITGNITVRKDATSNSTSTAAYAVISHGEDALGAVKSNYSSGAKGWCTGGATLTTQNCLANAATVASASFNDGRDAGTAYFDDVVVTNGRPQLLASVATTASTAYCWGRNFYGELGNGAGGNSNESNNTLIPVAVTMPTGVTFATINTSDGLSCAIGNNGRAYCWGSNSYGRLGDGTTTNRNIPTLVNTALTFTSIYPGYLYSCGIATNGVTYCWGNGYGNSPAAAPLPASGATSYTAVAAGDYHTCAIGNNGLGYCWGANGNGQLGVGSASPSSSATPLPVVMPGGVTFTAIHAQGNSTCAIGSNNLAYCWGNNSSGQLGVNNTTAQNRPTLVDMTTANATGGTGFTAAISTAGYGDSCAIGNNGRAYCWGSNSYNSLGDGTWTQRNLPVAVSLPTGVTAFNSISEGGFGCGIGNNKTAYCWGSNYYGQLGDGNGGVGFSNATPQSVVMPAGVTAFSVISAGTSHACAIAAPTLWTPANLATPPVGWWDAADETRITLASGSFTAGGPVSAWANKGSGGGSVTQATGSAQPTFSRTSLFGGKPALAFNGAQVLRAAAGIIPTLPQGSTPSAIFALATSSASTGVIAGWGQHGDSQGRWVSINGGNFASGMWNNDLDGSVPATSPGIVAQFLNTAAGQRLWINGALNMSGSASAMNTTSTQMAIGNLPASSGAPQTGRVSEVIVLNYVPTTTDQQKIEGYLAWRWGTVNKLPAGHPFKISAPTFP